MTKSFTGPGGDPAEGARRIDDANRDKEPTKTPHKEKATPKTPEDWEGDTGGGTHPPVKSETGA